MPVAIEQPDRCRPDRATCASAALRAARSASAAGGCGSASSTTCPTPRSSATERQFARLIEEAPPAISTCGSRSSPRQRRARADSAPGDGGRPIATRAQLRLSRPDATDRHRRRAARADLPEEPYWRELTALFDWSRRGRDSTLYSCLAAHAAVLHRDGIVRRRLARKLLRRLRERGCRRHELTRRLHDATVDAAFAAQRARRVRARAQGLSHADALRRTRASTCSCARRELLQVFCRAIPNTTRHAGARISPRHAAFPARRARRGRPHARNIISTGGRLLHRGRDSQCGAAEHRGARRWRWTRRR